MYYVLRGLGGEQVCISPEELWAQLTHQGLCVFGHDLATLAALTREYELRQGANPATPETVRQAFSSGSMRPVLLEVNSERVRQDSKWGQQSDDLNSPLDWHEVIADYNGWARRMLCMGSQDKGRKRLIQLAAVAVAEVEAIDRRANDQ